MIILFLYYIAYYAFNNKFVFVKTLILFKSNFNTTVQKYFKILITLTCIIHKVYYYLLDRK